MLVKLYHDLSVLVFLFILHCTANYNAEIRL